MGGGMSEIAVTPSPVDSAVQACEMAGNGARPLQLVRLFKAVSPDRS